MIWIDGDRPKFDGAEVVPGESACTTQLIDERDMDALKR